MLAPDGAVSPVDRTACPAPDGKHGTKYHRTTHGCTCPDGLADVRRHWYGLRYGDPIPEVLVSSVATARLLQAAAVRGHALTALAARTGLKPQYLALLRQGHRPQVTRVNADRVARVVHDLHAGPVPPNTNAVARCRSHAARQGWVALDEWLPDELGDPAALPDSAYRLADATPDAAATGRPRGLSTEDIDRIRDLFRRAAPYTFDRSAVAASFGCSAQVVSDVIAARRLPGYTDLRRSCPDRFIRSRPPEKWTDAQIDAVRAAFSAGQAPLDIARAHRIHDVAVHRMIRGRIRPHRHLTDLTGGRPLTGRSAAASPADSDDRKETAA